MFRVHSSRGSIIVWRQAETPEGNVGVSSLTFTTSGVSSATAESVGSSSLTFDVSGISNATRGRFEIRTRAGKAFVFHSNRQAQPASSEGVGSSSITFTVSGVSAQNTEAVGSSSLTFDVNGVSNAPVPETRPQAGGHSRVQRRRRFILPDNTEVYATQQEVYDLLQAFVKPKPTKKKVQKIVPLKDQVIVEEEKVRGEVVTKITTKPMSIYTPDPEVYESMVRRLKRRRTIELLLLAA